MLAPYSGSRGSHVCDLYPHSVDTLPDKCCVPLLPSSDTWQSPGSKCHNFSESPSGPTESPEQGAVIHYGEDITYLFLPGGRGDFCRILSRK